MKKKRAIAEAVLIEIGIEELPATNLADLFESGEKLVDARFQAVFAEKRLPFEKGKVYATPRRLVFHAEGVPCEQLPKEERVKLLAKQEAFDAVGKPTEKLLTILKHRGASVEDVACGELNGREVAFLKKTEPVRKTTALLPEIVAELIRTLPFPKNMRWNDSGVYFPRPIRNILCFYGDNALSFKIAGIRSSSDTVVFSRSRRRRFSVRSITAYFKTLEKQGILLDPVDRKKRLSDILAKLSKSLEGRMVDDPFLLNEVNFLVENPSGLSAPFGNEFLKLPLEVLTVSMARKQRIFGMVGRDGRVQPQFLAILDGAVSEKEKKNISSNIENILHAKLQDSLFFYREDLEIGLEKKREELRLLIFLKGAGSMLERSDRLVHLSKKLSAALGLNDNETSALVRAAFLSKADLLTQMVGEFPELQGVMGKYYALENGEAAVVAEAIGEQYLPRTVGDRLPSTRIGAALSILDKLDLLAACAGMGIEPSSSLDPYSLRRSATAIFKVALEHRLPLPVRPAIEAALAELGSYVQEKCASSAASKLEAFLKDRFKALLTDRGYREDLVEAVLCSSFDDASEVFGRVEALSGLVKKPYFSEAHKVVERMVNILKGNKETLPQSIRPELFTEDLEHRVHERYESFHARIQKASGSRDFDAATSLYAEAFFAIVDQFFREVFVNCEDLTVRKNRLALLKAVKDLYTAKIADLSKMRLTSSGA